MHEYVVGVGVSKLRLDIFDPRKGARQIDNETGQIRIFARAMARCRAFAVYEATGRYAWPLRDALEAVGVPYHGADPAQARHFARACGIPGKTDRVDARILASMGAAPALTPSVPPAPQRAF